MGLSDLEDGTLSLSYSWRAVILPGIIPAIGSLVCAFFMSKDEKKTPEGNIRTDDLFLNLSSFRPLRPFCSYFVEADDVTSVTASDPLLGSKGPVGWKGMVSAQNLRPVLLG